MFDATRLQFYLPGRLRYWLRPYYRRLFPNRLHMILYPTFRCNYRCSYCPVVTKFDYATVFRKAEERSASDWIAAFEKVPSCVIYIAGGEPFVYGDLPELVNNLPRKHALAGIVTNLSQPVGVYRRIKKRVHLNASFHREFIEEKEFISKIKELQEHFLIHVNIVATPQNLPFIAKIKGDLVSRGITLHTDPYVDPDYRYAPDELVELKKHVANDRRPEQQLDYSDHGAKLCSAGRNYVNIAANGDVFTCFGGMTFNTSPHFGALAAGQDLSGFRRGNLFNDGLRLSSADMACSMPCVEACDLDRVSISRAASDELQGRERARGGAGGPT